MSPPLSINIGNVLPAGGNDSSHHDDPSGAVELQPIQPLVLSSPERRAYSTRCLRAETNAARLQVLAAGQKDKGTSESYNRHIKNYERWFRLEQARLAAADVLRVPIDPFPITATKAAAFLAYETTRDKVRVFPFASVLHYLTLGILSLHFLFFFAVSFIFPCFLCRST